MKRSAVAFAFAFFFLLILLYVLYNTSPWDLQAVDTALDRFGITTGTDFSSFIDESVRLGIIWSLLDVKNVLLLLVAMAGTIISFVAAVHLLLDKVFIKRFYEEPNIGYAIRRGVIVFSLLAGVLVLRLLGGLVWYNVLAILILLVIIEYVFTSAGRKHTEEHHRKSKVNA